MKKTYQLADGGVITAASAEEFITRLRRSSKFDSECTDSEYAAQFADRCKIQTGNQIRTASPAGFLDDLLNCGYAKEL